MFVYERRKSYFCGRKRKEWTTVTLPVHRSSSISQRSTLNIPRSSELQNLRTSERNLPFFNVKLSTFLVHLSTFPVPQNLRTSEQNHLVQLSTFNVHLKLQNFRTKPLLVQRSSLIFQRSTLNVNR